MVTISERWLCQCEQGAEASSSSGSSLPAAAYMEWSHWRARYLSAMVDGLAAVLFDNRRGTCHCLMLNYWVRCGGLQAFLAQFGTAAQFLWDVTAADKALGSAPADQMEELPSTSGMLWPLLFYSLYRLVL